MVCQLGPFAHVLGSRRCATEVGVRLEAIPLSIGPGAITPYGSSFAHIPPSIAHFKAFQGIFEHTVGRALRITARRARSITWPIRGGRLVYDRRPINDCVPMKGESCQHVSADGRALCAYMK